MADDSIAELLKLKAEAEFWIFDSLPPSHREHLRNGGRVFGYEQACEAEFKRRWLAAQQEGLWDD